MAESLYAVQHIRRMLGGSQAHLLRASDGKFYVTKFKNNPNHVRVLASEYLATRLGILLGLPMAEVRIMDVSDWLITCSPELCIDNAGKAVPCAAGQQLASRYAADPEQDHIFDYLPETMVRRMANLDDFPRVLAFDKWTGNSDGRQAVYVKHKSARLYRAVFIDQGHCFNAGEWTFIDSPLRGTFSRNYVYEHVTGWNSFEPVLANIDNIQFSDLASIAAEIPPEWYQHDSEGLARLTKALHARRSLVRDLITSFRKSTRSPFPNWTAA
jgi:hypothetical protein